MRERGEEFVKEKEACLRNDDLTNCRTRNEEYKTKISLAWCKANYNEHQENLTAVPIY